MIIAKGEQTPKTPQYKWIALSNTTLGVLMSSLDANIVLIALPDIAKKLTNASPFDLLWILIGYQLVVSCTLVNIGRLGDLFGRVRIYNLGFAVFTVASFLCSFSRTGDQLLFFRLVQGFGAAMLTANSSAILTDAFPVHERGRALGINQASMVGGSLAGLVFGGFLTTVAGWQSIFLVNVPIGIFATIWAYLHLKELSARSHQKIDYPGNLIFATSLVLILAGLTFYAFETFSTLVDLAMTAAGLVLLIAFFLIERRISEPMLDVSLFKIRVFDGGIIATLLNSIARGAITLVLVFYLQSPVMGLNPLEAGIFLLPQSIAFSAFGVLGGWLSDRYGYRVMSTLGLSISSIGVLLLTQIPAKVTFLEIAVPLLISGAGVGLFNSPNRASVMSSVPADKRGLAGGMSSTMLNFGNSVSRTVAFLIMSLVLPAGDIQKLFSGSSSLANVSSETALINSVHLVYYFSATILFLAIIPSVLRGPQTSFDEEIGSKAKTTREDETL